MKPFLLGTLDGAAALLLLQWLARIAEFMWMFGG
jgi:hypothetical protein